MTVREIALPEALSEDWFIWRIVSAQRFGASLIEIETQWSMADVQRAHLVLDLFEEM